jgi:SAM-dependent methyltransferase
MADVQGSAAGWNAARAAQFFDEYGSREWSRFDDGRTPGASLDIHIRMLERFVRRRDLVLDAGAGPGRFTIELARLGAEVVTLDISPLQLDLHRENLTSAGFESSVRRRIVADVLDLSQLADDSFDRTVCFGGPVSYVAERADDALAELARVTRPGGHLLVSVMTLAGALTHYLPLLLELARRDGIPKQDEIVRTGLLPDEPDYGHLRMKLFRWDELERSLERFGRIVAAAAAGLLPDDVDLDPELRAFVRRTDLALSEDPGVVGCGLHTIAVVEVA